ncbi:MAG: CpaE family protein [Nostocoides sp.]
MTKVLIGTAVDSVASDLASLLGEMDDYDVRAVPRSTAELMDLAGRLDPDLIFIHEDLGIEPVTQTIRDLAGPATAILQVSSTRTPSMIITAMEAGARGVIAYPFAYEDVSSRVIAATNWASHMSGVLDGAAQVAGGRGRVVAVAGAKGGVGTTTVATHLAFSHADAHPNDRICIVDVDVEKGDLGALLEVRQSVSIADVAKVAGDLSTTAVNDAVIEHASGLFLLLAPLDVRETDFISPEALRSIIAILRREFALVVIDAGGYVSPAQAAVVEIADDVLAVTTPDVLAIRAMRRRMIAWEALGVREEAAFKVLINKVDKASIFPASSVTKLTTAHVLDAQIPFSVRLLEDAMNARDPRNITEVAWWRLLDRIRGELGLISQPTPVAPRAPAASASQAPTPASSRRRRPSWPSRRAKPEPVPAPAPEPVPAPAPGAPPAPVASPASGSAPAAPLPSTLGPDPAALSAPPQPASGSMPSSSADHPSAAHASRAEVGAIAVENAGILPMALITALVAWQVGVIGFSSLYASLAAGSAAREYSIAGTQHAAYDGARNRLPSSLRDGLIVTAGGHRVTVKLHVPGQAPAGFGLPQDVSISRSVVQEPS